MSIRNQISNLLRLGKADASSGAKEPTCELLQQLTRITEEAHREALANAHAAAAAGTGPQRWDADWYGNAINLSEEVEAMVGDWSWQQVQTFREVLGWALASPQGQRAQAMRGEPDSPWNDGLEMLEEMQMALTWRTQNLLHQQSRGLQYSQEQQQELEDALEELLHPQEEQA
jgi:hypothetical protein